MRAKYKVKNVIWGTKKKRGVLVFLSYKYSELTKPGLADYEFQQIKLQVVSIRLESSDKFDIYNIDVYFTDVI